VVDITADALDWRRNPFVSAERVRPAVWSDGLRRLPCPIVPTTTSDTWVALTHDELPVSALYDWAVRADCGAVVLFSGTVRDHAEGRPGVSVLEYEAYEEQVEPRLHAIVEEMRIRWPDLGNIALLHRVGELALGESSVVVAVSSPHRPEGFEAARFGIDTLKATVPIWKRETWEGGVDWGLSAHDVEDVDSLDVPMSEAAMSETATDAAVES
jgi:molybdopterin synthase catalytic subunit